MKKIIFIIILLTVIIEGCRYKEGPIISFHSVQKRLEGTWQVVGFTSNGADSLQNYNDSCGGNMQIIFPPKGAGSEVHINFVPDANKPFKGNGGMFDFGDHSKSMYVHLPISSFKSLGPIGANTISHSIYNTTQ